MKKMSKVFLILFVLILMTGCGNGDKEEKLVCTTVENEDEMMIEQVISMTYKNDQLNHMTMEANSKITDATVQENWEDFKEFMDKDNQEFDKEGVRLKVEADDQNYEYRTILDIDVLNANEEVLKEQGFEGLKEDNSTLEESKKIAEQDGAICVVK